MFCDTETAEGMQIELQTLKKVQNYYFRPIDVIGQGNFSKVYSGMNEKNGRKVAIKVVRMSSLKSKLALKLLENQICILKIMKNQNIINCYDVFTSQNNCYIITELCEGGDLENIIRRHKLEQFKIISLIYDIYKGLSYLAENCIIHRDLKVANIFLTKNKVAKIADFGFATKATSVFKDISIGSPIYMSPQGLLKHQYGPKTDIWSFGILLYELTHGDTPLSKCKTQQQLKFGILQPPKIKANISDDFKQLIKYCMVVDEKQRINIQQIGETNFMRRIKREIQGVKLNKYSYSAYYSTNISETNSLQILLKKYINYQIAVSLLHYCRLIHKTCQKYKSPILSQWLLYLSNCLQHKNIIKKDINSLIQIQRLNEVIFQYHNKYEKQHHNIIGMQININQVLIQCQRIKNLPQIISSNIFMLIKETQLLQKSLNFGQIQYFATNSQVKAYLSRNR